MLLSLISLILSNLLKNVFFNASFLEARVRYKAVANGVNKPVSIRMRKIASPVSGSPRNGAANQHTHVTTKVSVKNRIGL